jgi:hypothetical protein
MAGSRQAEALVLAEELLGDIELRRISPADVALKATRLARLTDDADTEAWLAYEIVGYGEGTLTEHSQRAAARSFRHAPNTPDGSRRWWTTPLGQLQANIESNRAVLATLTGDVAGDMALLVERDRQQQRQHLTSQTAQQVALVDRILGAIYVYASRVYQALRFGSAVETAFEVVRTDVDLRLATLIPDGLAKLSAAFENASSSNPEHWANAAATCRRLLKAAADALRPPGDPRRRPASRRTDRRRSLDAAG